VIYETPCFLTAIFSDGHRVFIFYFLYSLTKVKNFVFQLTSSRDLEHMHAETTRMKLRVIGQIVRLNLKKKKNKKTETQNRKSTLVCNADLSCVLDHLCESFFSLLRYAALEANLHKGEFLVRVHSTQAYGVCLEAY
jgi:hypothetical protein